jgi:hypothetical protein
MVFGERARVPLSRREGLADGLLNSEAKGKDAFHFTHFRSNEPNGPAGPSAMLRETDVESRPSKE